MKTNERRSREQTKAEITSEGVAHQPLPETITFEVTEEHLDEAKTANSLPSISCIVVKALHAAGFASASCGQNSASWQGIGDNYYFDPTNKMRNITTLFDSRCYDALRKQLPITLTLQLAK